jgi:hypothetical protein
MTSVQSRPSNPGGGAPMLVGSRLHAGLRAGANRRDALRERWLALETARPPHLEDVGAETIADLCLELGGLLGPIGVAGLSDLPVRRSR